MPQEDNTLRTEITAFMQKAFSGCKIIGDYWPGECAWIFKISFETNKHVYTINPPRGCFLMKISSTETMVEFEMTVFVEDFKKHHLKQISN